MNFSIVQKCGIASLLCSIWNLFGDVYFLDFYISHMDDEEFAMVRSDLRHGYIFSFEKRSLWLSSLAQTGGWIYPAWAFATVVPLYVGLQSTGVWNSLVPCAILAYSLCVVGGALHSSFAFLTILPDTYHHPIKMGDWQDLLQESLTFSNFLEMVQTSVIQHLVMGCLPGCMACNIASAWIAFVIQTKPSTKFPKWIHLCNPLVTIIWISVLGSMLPDPWDFYIVGSMGTWGVMILNLVVVYVLWNDHSAEMLFSPFLSKAKEN